MRKVVVAVVVTLCLPAASGTPGLAFAQAVDDKEGAYDIAVDRQGYVYVAGQTDSGDFPVVRPAQAVHGGGIDAFVAKFRPSGGGLVYATFLGGVENDFAMSVVADVKGNAYVTGRTESPNFPVVAARQSTLAGRADGFLVKLDPAGKIVYSTYHGGSGNETAAFVAVDDKQRPTVVGTTRSRDYPTVRALQNTYGGAGDFYVARYDASGQRLTYSTYLGGAGFDDGLDIELDNAGRPVIVGRSDSADFPVSKTGALQPSLAGGSDGIVAKLSADGARLIFATYMGGALDDIATSVAVGPGGGIYLMGRTDSTDYPTLNAFQPTFGGHYDVVVTKIGPRGGKMLYSTYFGGSDIEFGLTFSSGIEVLAGGVAAIAGKTLSFDMPTQNAAQPDYAGGYDIFVAKIGPAGDELLYSSYLGGVGNDFGIGIANDKRSRIYVGGKTDSDDFPTAAPFQRRRTGGYDVIVSKLKPSGALVFSTYLGGSSE